MEWRRDDGYTISTDPGRVDRQAVWEFLPTSYWSPGIEFEQVSQGIDNSLVFGVTDPGGSQAGFARAVTDRTRFERPSPSPPLRDVPARPGVRGRRERSAPARLLWSA